MEDRGYHPDLPAELEQALRAAHRALEPAAVGHLTFVTESKLDGSEVIGQLDQLVGAVRHATNAAMGPAIWWESCPSDDFSVPYETIDFDNGTADTLGWKQRGTDFGGSGYEEAARLYRREAGWDFPPGEAGVWLYAVEPYSYTGNDASGTCEGHLVPFAILHDRDEDGTYESLAHIWTCWQWRRRGVASKLLAIARTQYLCSTEEEPFTDDGAALLASSRESSQQEARAENGALDGHNGRERGHEGGA